VSFPARGASADPHRLVITSGDETVEMENIVIGDVWVMNGQSNMAWSLGKTLQSDLESPSRPAAVAPRRHQRQRAGDPSD